MSTVKDRIIHLIEMKEEQEENVSYVIFRLVGVVQLIVAQSSRRAAAACARAASDGDLSLEMIEKCARRIGRSLGVQVDDVHQRRHDQSVAQRR